MASWPFRSRVGRRATRVSLPLIGAFMVGAIAYGGLYTFPAISIAFADEFGISRTLAVTPWTMFLLVTALASPLLGRAYDEFADRDLLTASMVLLAAGWLAVYLAGDISLVILAYAVFMAIGLQLAFIGIAVHGLGTGATIAVRSAAFSDVFGGANFGTIFGLLAVAYPVGGALAVYFGAAAYDATGSFAPLVPVVLVALVVWATSLWVAGPRRPRRVSAR